MGVSAHRIVDRKEHEMTPLERKQTNDAIYEANLELDVLSKKPSLNPQERRRSDFLLSRLANLRAGFGLNSVMQHELHKVEAENGFERTEFQKPDGLSDESRAFCQFLKTGEWEKRDSITGLPIVPNGYAGGGSFSPVEFFAEIFAALKAHDPIIDPESVTLISTENGRPIMVPYLSDTANVSVLTTELASASETDIASADQALLGAYSYRSPIFRCSIESVMDTENAVPILEIFRKFATDRTARGVSKDLLLGSAKTVGLLPSLLALPYGIGAIAGGSNVNDGLGGTGHSTIGSDDIASLFFSVNAEYRASDRCAFWMNDSTLLALSKQKDKNGSPLLDLTAPRLTLLSKIVRVSPNMPSIGASTTPIAFGDFSYWATRQSVGTGYVQRFSQTAGLAEAFKVGFRMFTRWDGALLFDDVNSAPPIRLLQMLS